MKVYLVYTGEYEERTVDRVFTTLEAATTYCSYHEGASYEAWETESYYSPSDPYWFVRAHIVFDPVTHKVDHTERCASLFDHDEPQYPRHTPQFFSSLGYIFIHRLLPLSLYPTEKDAIDFVKNIANEVSKDCFSLATRGKTQEYINDFIRNKVYGEH